MEFVVQERENIHIISVKCDIVADNVDELKKLLADLLATERVCIVIDMEAVNYIDSAGLAILIGRLNEFRRKKGDLHLASMGKKVREVFDVTFLSSLFKIYAGVEEACRDFLTPAL